MTDSNEIHVRHEQPGDEAAIAHVNHAAFGQPDESRIVDAIREGGHSVISLVAVDGPNIVGHILFTPIAFDPPGAPITILGLGPMAVLPPFQRQGIGSMLVKSGLEECRRAGCHAVIVIGHPEYYPRFGFTPARAYGLRSEFEVPDDVFMVAELSRDVLRGRGGLVRYLAEFGGA